MELNIGIQIGDLGKSQESAYSNRQLVYNVMQTLNRLLELKSNLTTIFKPLIFFSRLDVKQSFFKIRNCE